jgi:hypothetical protein
MWLSELVLQHRKKASRLDDRIVLENSYKRTFLMELN